MSCAKTAEPIQMPFGMKTGGPKEPCVRCGSRSLTRTCTFEGLFIP